jgi:hypothetical protein
MQRQLLPLAITAAAGTLNVAVQLASTTDDAVYNLLL